MEMNSVTTGIQSPVYQNTQSANPVQSVKHQNTGDTTEFSTKQPEIATPWYKKPVTIILAGLAVLAAGCLILRRKGGEQGKEIINKVENAATEELSLDQLFKERQKANKLFEEETAKIDEIKSIKWAIEYKEKSLNEYEISLEEQSQAKNKIKKFVSEQIINNKDLKKEWNFLEKIETCNNKITGGELTEDELVNIKMAQLKPVITDLMLAKMGTEKAKEVNNNFTKHFGFSLDQVRKMFKNSQNKKSNEEIVKEFNPLLIKMSEKLKTDAKCECLSDLFLTKNLTKVIGNLTENKEKLNNPEEYFLKINKKYAYIEFLPEDLCDLLYYKRNSYSIDACKIGINELTKEIPVLKNKIEPLELELKSIQDEIDAGNLRKYA